MALFLKQDAMKNSFDPIPSLTVDMYERNEVIGGRIQTLSLFSSTASTENFELGASIMHDSNLYMKMFAEHLNLTTVKPVRTNRQFGIFDGSSFLYRSSKGFLDFLWFIWRYGLWDFLRLRREVNRVAVQFAQFYHDQSASDLRETMTNHCGVTPSVGSGGCVHDTPVPHDTVEDMLESVGLFNLTQQSVERYLLDTVKLSPTSKLLTEIIAAAVRVNYNQPLGAINGLAGAVGIIPLSKPELFAVREGNERIPQLLTDRYVDNIYLSHRVETVRRTSRGTFVVSGSTTSGAPFSSGEVGEEYDAVVVAMPLGATSDAVVLLESDGSRVVLGGESRLQYKHTVSTFVEGRLSCGYFNLSQDQCRNEPLPASLLTADPSLTTAATVEDRIGFTSIGSYFHSEERNTTVYKVFSHAPLTENQLSAMFSHIHLCDNASNLAGNCGFHSHDPSAASQTGSARCVHSKDWLAYPAFGATMQSHVPFRLAPGLYHVGAFEAAVSCMECMAVAARNVALLVARDVLRPAAVAVDGVEKLASNEDMLTAGDAHTSAAVEVVEVIADGGLIAAAREVLSNNAGTGRVEEV